MRQRHRCTDKHTDTNIHYKDTQGNSKRKGQINKEKDRQTDREARRE